ncbi:TWiK family of potassium channels protein 7-like isoform X1 [Cataglyphis hispanica]|uniref:TWiK family of potassium channels protein 7-like isoform X1 n=2 Tax=Cataglyphis hispanica TaxID=1086592 RepID=UPI0021807D66|nr:TWiK family of potassium channels protein 7-like isoform X1 [Cataglyphis hispanica]XP_050466861.1 TWiK family of potassium channels protein 7-like isoform X1 [Cataglyphis hispanica]
MVNDKCNSSVELDAAMDDEDAKGFLKKETVRKIKSIAGHMALLITLMLYTAIGGLVFRQIELPAELGRLERLRAKLRMQRYRFIESISNNTDVFNLRTLINVKLCVYEEAVQEAAEAGLLVSFVNTMDQDAHIESDLPPIVTERWSILQAVFFASTVLTTIGYGNVVPSTNWGRIFCIFFALIGIPLTLIVIADLGKLFAEGVVYIALKLKLKLLFRAKLSCVPTNVTGRRSLGACAAIILLFLYLACGAGMFMLWEDDWNFFDGFYFCFVTMTTIGFGDLVPKKPKYTLLCTLYILVGLALTSTIIELVRRQYAQSWRRLQRLSGPLAETLRKLGEQAGGDMSALHSDLKKVLTIISMPRLRWSTSIDRDVTKDRDWEEAVEAVLRDIAASATVPPPKKPIVQIVVYESSV